jgi:cell division protein FtsL
MTRRFLMLWCAAVIASATAFVVHLALRFENVRLGYEVGREYQEQRRLFETRRLLSLEAQTLRQVERIEPFARDVLHMEVPGPERAWVLRGQP